MRPPCYVKDVQKLIGSMAALNCFISRLSEKGLPFFKLLKKIGKFEWTEEAKEAFESLKVYLTSSPILTPPKKHEDMMLYIAATSTVVSVAIAVEKRRRRPCIQSTASGILRQRSSDRLKNTISACTKTTLCPPDYFPQATTLL
jgi:hypothetical protein